MLSRPLAILFLASAVSATAFAQSTQSSFSGNTAGLNVGRSMDEVGDINGDGYVDMVVGAPTIGGYGHIYFISGKYLSTGIGPISLGLTISPTVGGEFGAKLISVGDVSGDGVSDVIVMEPRTTLATDGVFHLVSGASKSILWTLFSPIGGSYEGGLCRCGDVDADGYTDFAIAEVAGANTFVQVLSARRIYLNNNSLLYSIPGPSATEFGLTISAGDFDGNGQQEIAVGAPAYSSDRGGVWVYHGGFSYVTMRVLTGAVPGSRFGSSLDASRDVDADGRKDLLVGAPNSNAGGTAAGQVTLFNGARIAANQAPFDDAVWTGTQANAHFGAAVCFTPDMNADFRTDIVVGAPDHDSVSPLFVNNGRVFLYSGETLHLLGSYSGSNNEHLGTSLSRAWDFDGDLRFEIAAGAPLSDAAATDGGLVRFISLFPALPSTYCVAKINSLGCTPAISYTGSPSLSSASSFLIKASNLINNKASLLLYAYDDSATPFQGGTLCLSGGLKRYGAGSSAGNPPPNDCSGTRSIDFNVLIQSGTVGALNMAGQQVFAQYWGRDPAAVAGSSLTNALTFVINS